jgi:hypothetical protein
MIRYRPNTCKCVIILEKDGATFSKFENRCSKHKKTDGSKVLDDIRKFNQEINKKKTKSK